MFARSGHPPPWTLPPPPLLLHAAALSVDYQQIATFEHDTEPLWSNSYKMPNKTYGQQLPESRSLHATMDHCYGMDDVMTELRLVRLFFIFAIFLRRKISVFICACHWWCHVCYSVKLNTLSQLTPVNINYKEICWNVEICKKNNNILLGFKLNISMHRFPYILFETTYS